MFCLTDCQRSTFDHTGLARWYYKLNKREMWWYFPVLKCMYPLTSNPSSKNLFFSYVRTYAQRHLYMGIYYSKRMETKSVLQQKICKVNYSKSIKWNIVQPLKSTRQIYTYQYGTISRIIWLSGRKKQCAKQCVSYALCVCICIESLWKNPISHEQMIPL